jgi:hypothetical protein
MQPEPRRAVAYIAARLISKRNGSSIYNFRGYARPLAVMLDV